ncbi:MAG: phytoene desaturase family protein [Solirubrobacteraceae bacterium]
MTADAIVIGSGSNGLVAANLLADAGWEVLVLEAAPGPGGSVRSAELIEPGYANDIFSSFYPLGAASPHIRGLELEEFGLKWVRSDTVLAHPSRAGDCPILSTDLDLTAASLERFAAGDGQAWRDLYRLWERVGEHLLGTLFDPFPPVVSGLRLAGRLGPRELVDFVRFSLLTVRRMGEESFAGEGGRRLLAGSALHADLGPDTPPSGTYGWVLTALGQERGFPVPEGGAGQLTRAMVDRLTARGGQILFGQEAASILIRRGRAAGVATVSGEEFGARRAVLADVGAPQLYQRLVGEEHLPAGLLADLERFEYDSATVKVDWTLDAPIPWAAEPARAAGTIHVGEDVDALAKHSGELARSLVPERPYLVMGQYAHFDPTRQPAGAETAWAYTHVPQHIKGDAGRGISGGWDESDTERMAERIEAEVEALAPGFRALIRGRHVFTPPTMEAANANLVGGAINGGTSQLHQQFIFRPTPAAAGPHTPVRRLFLASASAHPGGGVHGTCGANAARAALGLRHGQVKLPIVGLLARAEQRRR